MVQNESTNDDVKDMEKTSIKMINNHKPRGIPIGNYKLIGWGVDTTGRRLIDEICHIAGYTIDQQFSQYIMPFADLNPIYKKKHNIRVVNTGKFRLLKDLRKNKFVRTKSDISALTEFIIWLELLGKDTDGIILIYYEQRKSIAGLLLEILRRLNLLERFSNIVHGFLNVYDLIIDENIKKSLSIESLNLRFVANFFLKNSTTNLLIDDLGNAIGRGKISYQLVMELANQMDLMAFVCPMTNPIVAEEEEIARFKLLLERQNTFRPIFDGMLRAGVDERKHATHLRRILAENNLNYQQLKTVYDGEAKDGLDKILKNEISNANENELKELLNILDSFFDPDKKPIQPKPRYYYNNNNRRIQGGRRYGGNGGGGGGGESSTSANKNAKTTISTNDSGLNTTDDKSMINGSTGDIIQHSPQTAPSIDTNAKSLEVQ